MNSLVFRDKQEQSLTEATPKTRCIVMLWNAIFRDRIEILGLHIAPAAQIIIAFILALFGWFLIQYVLRGILLRIGLWRLTRRIKNLRDKQRAAKAVVDPESLDALLGRRNVFRHLWSEYRETLHEQWENRDGERKRVNIRATVPAEAYFTTEVLVDTRLATEFFKHLPGILTGIGIIGTFYGLITGLADFNLQLDPQSLQVSIGRLMGAVTDAFMASGAAIAAAMLITLIEKLLLASCYGAVEKLAHAIDSLYEAGAGEEYLARLVESSEQNAVQTRQLKDSLVDDIRQLLTELTDRQIDAGRQHGETLSSAVGEAIRGSLAEPMRKIGEVVDNTTTGQGEAVQRMLADLLSAFMEKLDGSIGGQMTGLQDMMAGTVRAMEGMRGDFADMLEKMGETSGKASQAATEQMVRLMAEAEERQRQMNNALLDAVKDMRQQMTGAQTDIQGQTAATLAQLRTTLQEMLEEIRRQREEAAKSTTDGIAQLTESLSATAAQIRQTAEQMGQTGSDQLARLLAQAEERQNALSESLRQTLVSLGQNMTEGSRSIQDKTVESLEKMGSAVDGMLMEIRRQREETAQAARDDLAGMKSTLSDLAATIKESGTTAAEANTAHARALLDEIGQRQQEAEKEAASAHEASQRQLQATVDGMAGALTHFLETAQERETRQAGAAQAFQEDVARRTAEVLDSLDRRLGDLATSSGQAVTAMRDAVDALNGATGRAIDGMTRGAETMLRAADGFTEASGRIGHTVGRTAELLDKVVTASSSLDISVRAVESVVASYNATRDTLQNLTATLQGIVQDADARAGVGRDLVATMRTLVSDFERIQAETSGYLDKVGSVLKTGFDSFATAVTTNMSRTHGEFHKSLSDAVQMISGQLQELEVILSGFSAKAKALV